MQYCILPCLSSDKTVGQASIGLVFQMCENMYTYISPSALDDFVGGSRSVTFLPGNTTVCEMIGIVDDSIVEDTEPFTVLLSSSDSQVTVNATNAEATVAITDDDRMYPSELYL